MGRIGRWLESLGRVLWLTSRSYVENRGSTAAAALAYHTFFSIFPLLLFISALASFWLEGQVTQEALELALSRLLPGTDRFVYAVVQGLVSQRATVSIIATAGLFWTAGGVFRVMNGALDQAFGVRSGYRSLLRPFLIVAVMPVLFVLLTGLVNATGLLPLVRWGLSRSGLVGLWFSWGVDLVAAELALLAFWALYHYLPGCPVRWQASLGGALPASLVWSGVAQLFAVVIGLLFNFSPVYGPLTAVVVLLLWSYISASIFLFGAEMAAVLNRAEDAG